MKDFWNTFNDDLFLVFANSLVLTTTYLTTATTTTNLLLYFQPAFFKIFNQIRVFFDCSAQLKISNIRLFLTLIKKEFMSHFLYYFRIIFDPFSSSFIITF